MADTQHLAGPLLLGSAFGAGMSLGVLISLYGVAAVDDKTVRLSPPVVYVGFVLPPVSLIMYLWAVSIIKTK